MKLKQMRKILASEMRDRLEADIVDDGHIVNKCSVKYKSFNNKGKYHVSVRTKFNDTQTVDLPADGYDESAQDVVGRMLADAESRLEMYKGNKDTWRERIELSLRDQIQTYIDDELRNLLFNVKITNYERALLTFGKEETKCGEFGGLGIDLEEVSDSAEITITEGHRFLNGGVSEVELSPLDISKIIEMKWQKIQEKDIIVNMHDGQRRVLKHYGKAKRIVSEIVGLLKQVYDPLYIGIPKEFSTEETIIVNIGKKEIEYKLFNASVVFDIVTGEIKTVQNDDVKKMGEFYAAKQELITRLETMLSEENAHISVLPKYKEIGLLLAGQTELIVQYNRYNKKLPLTLPGADKEELWMKKVYGTIRNAVKELQAEEAAKLNEMGESYLMLAIYSVISEDDNHLPITKIVDILRGTNGYSGSEMGRFSFYSQDQIKRAVDQMCMEGIISERKVKGLYRQYMVYKVINKDFSPAPIPKISKKDIEPFLSEPHKATDTLSAAIIFYYQKRKRISTQEYMVILRCTSDYVLVTQAEEIAGLCKNCPEEITDMLKMLIDAEEDRQLKKAYKIIKKAAG